MILYVNPLSLYWYCAGMHDELNEIVSFASLQMLSVPWRRSSQCTYWHK